MSGDGFLGPRATGVTRELPRPVPPPPGPMPARWTAYPRAGWDASSAQVCAYMHASRVLVLQWVDRPVTTVDWLAPMGSSITPAELAEVTRDVHELCTWLARGGSAGA